MHEWVLLILPTQTEYCAVYKIGLGCSTKELRVNLLSVSTASLFQSHPLKFRRHFIDPTGPFLCIINGKLDTRAHVCLTVTINRGAVSLDVSILDAVAVWACLGVGLLIIFLLIMVLIYLCRR